MGSGSAGATGGKQKNWGGTVLEKSTIEIQDPYAKSTAVGGRDEREREREKAER